MSVHEFVFELRVEDRTGAAADLVDDVTARILSRLGFGEAVSRAVLHPLRTEVEGGRGSICVVQYAAHGGELEITVSSAARPRWRLARPLP